MSTSIDNDLYVQPKDVLIIGDSMIKRLNVYGHPQNVWKYCYPGATVEELHPHILTEKLPGEAIVSTVMINLGTNDLSRSRQRYRTVKEVFEFMKLFMLRLSHMYPQATIVFVHILPRLDCDNNRVRRLNDLMLEFILDRDEHFDRFDFTSTFTEFLSDGPLTGRRTRLRVKTEYFIDSPEDSVHLSDSGTQVQQDAFNRYFQIIHGQSSREFYNLRLLMWQSQWEHFLYWNLKHSDVAKNSRMECKRLTNFGPAQRLELLQTERLRSNQTSFNTDSYYC